MTSKEHTRITGKHVWNSFIKAFDLEKGLIFTLVELTLRPGQAIENYFDGDRKLFNPIKYAIFGIAFFEIYSFVEEKINGATGDENDLQHYSLGFVIGIVIVSFTFYLINLKRGYNFFEYLVATIFTATQIYIFMTLFEIITPEMFDHIDIPIFPLIWVLLILIYVYWIVRSLFKLSIVMTIISILASFISASIFPILTRKSPYFLDLVQSILTFFN